MNSSRTIALAILLGLFGAAHAIDANHDIDVKDRGIPTIAQPAGADKAEQPIEIFDQLVNIDPADRVTNCPHKVHVIKLRAGKTYLVSMARKDNNQPFNPWLRIEDSAFKQLVPDPARISVTVRTRFTPPKDDVYRIIASCNGGLGEYVLRIAPDDSGRTGVDDEGFLLRWLVLAPIPLAPNQSGADAIGKEQITNENNLTPKAGQKATVGGKEFAWKEHVVNDTVLDFISLLDGPKEDAVAYAVTYVIAPQEMKGVKLKAGSDDQLKIYLNGKEVMNFTGQRAVGRDQNEADVTLRKGVNVLVAKVVNEKGDWGLCVRFTDGNNRPLAALKCRAALK